MTIWTVLAQTGSLFAYFVVFVPYFFWVIFGAFDKNILLLFLAIPLSFFVISTSIGLMLLMKSLRLDHKTEITVDLARKKMIFQRENQKKELLNSDVLSIELCGFGIGKMFDFSYYKISTVNTSILLSDLTIDMSVISSLYSDVDLKVNPIKFRFFRPFDVVRKIELFLRSES